jgi:hypothetical protein
MTQANHIISKAGGVTALSRMLGHKHRTTVQGWLERGYIHPRNWPRITEAFDQEGIRWTRDDFIDWPLLMKASEKEAAVA